MPKLFRLVALVAFLSAGASAQFGGKTIIVFPSTPSGACSQTQLGLNGSTAALYSCNSSFAWVAVGGGGVGTVTSITAGMGLSGGTITGSGTIAVLAAYQLPQSCSNGQTAIWGTPIASQWNCGSGSGGDTITSPNSTLNIGGTASATTLDLAGSAGKIMAGATPALTATPTLGASGTLGSLTFGNATSGLLTIEPVTGALGTVTLLIPGASDQLVARATTDTESNKTFVAPALGTPASGAITNLTGNCTNCGSNTVNSAASTTNSSFSILTGSATSGQQEPSTIASFTINPSTGAMNVPGALTVSSCSGCGGGGNTTSTSLTSNTIPKANGANSIINSLFTDNGTTGTYSGTGGITASGGPLTAGNPSGGVGSSVFLTQEGTVPSGLSTSAEDNCYADSTQHGLLCNFNAGTTLPLIQGPASATSGHIATFSGTNGGKVVDGGAVPTGTVTSVATTGPITGGTFTTSGTIACATCVTSGASLTSNAIMTGAGSQASQTVADFTIGGTAHTLLAGASGLVDLSAETGANSFKLPAVVGGTSLSGTATGNLSAPAVFANANSTNNNTSFVAGFSASGSSTGQTVVNLNQATTGGDILDWGTGGSYASGVLSGQTISGSILENGSIQMKGTTAGFLALTQGSTSASVAPCNAATTHCIQANSAVTAGVETDAPALAQGIPTRVGSSSAITDGYTGDAGHSATVSWSTATTVGSTSLCSTTNCPAGTYRVNVYIDVTTACSTTGSYVVNVIWTDDTTVSKTSVIPLVGLGVTPTFGPTAITATLVPTSTTDFGMGSFILRSTGTTSINYSTTAGACATGGPGVGKLYFSVEPLQ
jgi:hypothetical protein